MILQTGMLGPDQPWWVIFFALAIGHMLADYPLQGEFLALRKNHKSPPDAGIGGGPSPKFLWFHCLTAHSMIHGGVVWLITGIPILGIAETIAHWIIDYAKSEGWTGFNFDQLLHLICKAAFATLIVMGIVAAGA